jgi:hypothetical protein
MNVLDRAGRVSPIEIDGRTGPSMPIRKVEGNRGSRFGKIGWEMILKASYTNVRIVNTTEGDKTP